MRQSENIWAADILYEKQSEEFYWLHSFVFINFHSDYQQNNQSPEYNRCIQFSICVRTDILEEL